MMSEVKFVDTTLRDGHQSLWAENMTTGMMLPVAKRVTKTPLRLIAGRVNTFEITPHSVYRLFLERMAANGLRQARISDEWNDLSSWQRKVQFSREIGLDPIVNIIYSVSPKHTDEYFAERTRQAASLPL